MFCVELGVKQESNCWRMTTSIVVDARNVEDARSCIKREQPLLLDGCEIHRVFEVTHVVVDWPTGYTAIIEGGN